MKIEDIKKGDTVTLVAQRNTRDITYTGIAVMDYKADCGNPGVGLKMAKTGKRYFLRESRYGLRLTSWRNCSLLNVAEYGYFVGEGA